MHTICVPEVQAKLAEAFASGLREAYGPALGTLGRDVILYHPLVTLHLDELKRCVELESAPVLKAIIANKVTGTTLLEIRSLLVGAALLGDKAGVIRWATEGKNRCADGGGNWPATALEWEAALATPDQFIQLARQIKYFMHQI